MIKLYKDMTYDQTYDGEVSDTENNYWMNNRIYFVQSLETARGTERLF